MWYSGLVSPRGLEGFFPPLHKIQQLFPVGCCFMFKLMFKYNQPDKRLSFEK